MSLLVLLSLREGRGIMPPISSPKHVPTGVPSPSVNRKEWSVLGFYPGAPTHGSKTWVAVQFWNDLMSLYLIVHSAERERGQTRLKMKGMTWRKSHAEFKSRLLWEHLNCFGRVNHQNTSSKAMIYEKKSHSSHIAWSNFTTQCIWKERDDVCTLLSGKSWINDVTKERRIS